MIPRLVYGNPQAAADEMASYFKAAAERRRRRRFWRTARRWAIRAAALLAIVASGISLHECTPANAAPAATTPQSTNYGERSA